MDVENRLRKFMSDIMAPFNERIGTLNKDVKKLKTDRDYCTNQLQSVNNKIDAFSHFKDQLGKLSNDINSVVSSCDSLKRYRTKNVQRRSKYA